MELYDFIKDLLGEYHGIIHEMDGVIMGSVEVPNEHIETVLKKIKERTDKKDEIEVESYFKNTTNLLLTIHM